MKKGKKIPILEFVNEKKLVKIERLIESSDDIEYNYDRIEVILGDDFKVKDLGTNRLIFIHKKNKYKDLIFKVAGDSHGVEANYREFFNGDLDDALTYSYSISDNGVFTVQERVTPMDSKTMEKRKKDVRKMLEHLEKKILLVDCKLSNFKNFGVRKNGDVCLLDHGDTVPLNKYQSDNIVNINEECNVSLRCKRYKEAGAKNSEPCNGKLFYSKNYDRLTCERCGSVMTVNEAYKEFWGDARVSTKLDKHIDTSEFDFDIDEWREKCKEYCINSMGKVKTETNKKGENEMKVKEINGEKCRQLKGYWVPESMLNSEDWAIIVLSVKDSNESPERMLKMAKYNPDEYKVNLDEHTPNKVYDFEDVRIFIEDAINNTEPGGSVELTYDYIKKCTGMFAGTFEREREIYGAIIKRADVSKMIYSKTGFYIVKKDEDEKNTPSIESSENYEHKKHDIENADDVDANEYVGISENNEEFDYGDHILKNDVECVLVGKYYIPVDIINKLSMDISVCDNRTIKTFLKLNGLNPKDWKNKTDSKNTKTDALDDDDGDDAIGAYEADEIAYDHKSDLEVEDDMGIEDDELDEDDEQEYVSHEMTYEEFSNKLHLRDMKLIKYAAIYSIDMSQSCSDNKTSFVFNAEEFSRFLFSISASYDDLFNGVIYKLDDCTCPSITNTAKLITDVLSDEVNGNNPIMTVVLSRENAYPFIIITINDLVRFNNLDRIDATQLDDVNDEDEYVSPPYDMLEVINNDIKSFRDEMAKSIINMNATMYKTNEILNNISKNLYETQENITTLSNKITNNSDSHSIGRIEIVDGKKMVPVKYDDTDYSIVVEMPNGSLVMVDLKKMIEGAWESQTIQPNTIVNLNGFVEE